MYTQFFTWLEKLFIGLGGMWTTLMTPIGELIGAPSSTPDWLQPVFNSPLLYLIGATGLVILIIVGILKCVWDALPVA